MPTTLDGLSGRIIQPPGPDPPADAAPPPKAGWLARTCCRVAGHTGEWTYPDERCVRVRMCQRCGEVTSKQEHTWVRSATLPQAGASRSAGVAGAARLSHASYIDGVRSSMVWTTISCPNLRALRRSGQDLFGYPDVRDGRTETAWRGRTIENG